MTAEDRFWAMVSKGPDCWEWTGYVNDRGYGRFGIEKGRTVQAHRFAYEAEWGPIPEGATLDHLCRNRRCVRPLHLEAVSNRANVLRGEGPTARNNAKEACDQGHPFTDENTRRDRNGWRICLTCKRAAAREHFARKRAEEKRLLAMVPALLDVAEAARAHAEATHVGLSAQDGLVDLRMALARLDPEP